jgi:hypothetical protein
MASGEGYVGRVSRIEEESRELFETANAVVSSGLRSVLLRENGSRVCSFQATQNDKTKLGVFWLAASFSLAGVEEGF